MVQEIRFILLQSGLCLLTGARHYFRFCVFNMDSHYLGRQC